MPMRLYGVVPVMVEDPGTRLSPVIEMASEIRSQKPIVIKVSEAKKKAMTYTVAVVDEGLLDITGFKTPDPWKYFYAREALGVQTWDLYDFVLGAFGGTLERVFATGGDEAAIDRSANKAKRFVPVVKFLGSFTLGAGKTNTHTIILPHYTGSVRTMIIAGSDRAFGAAEKSVLVKDPLMLLVTAPRVVSPGEKVALPVSIFIQKEGIKDITIKAEGNDLVSFEEKTKNISVSGTGEKDSEFSFTAAGKTGKAKISVTATGGGESATYNMEIEVRSPNPPDTHAEVKVIRKNEKFEATFKPFGVEGSNSALFQVSSLPSINLEKRMDYLLDYPYGCSEQITSAAFPQLWLGELTSNDQTITQTASANITEAISKLISRQMINGGIVLWPGSSQPDNWVTSYDDGQWRFPAMVKVPEKYEKSLLTFEDSWFYYHPGINPVSIFRALKNNIKARAVVSGGSTITMQVARISGGNKKRSYTEKFIEVLSALKLEMFRSKKKILQLYSSNAPFGGNTVGLEAASWRYTGKSSSDLTWAEAAVLAILPNSPALVFPGRNSEKLKIKRDALLKRLCERKYIDSVTLVLALDEPLPGEPQPLPSKAPHLTDHFFATNRGEMIKTTIDPVLQERATELLNAHQKDLSGNFIFNSACLIVEVETGNVLAYVGNSTLGDAHAHNGDVVIIRSSRSTGSILKPLLYAGIQNSGDILPNTLIADVPIRFPGFSPKNFDQSYSGAVSAASALSQSLNIPAVKMLQKYNPEKFLDLLHNTGFTTFNKPADYYGLSLILGGGETSLWDLTGVYASLSRVLNSYLSFKKYYKEDYKHL